jgi:hypothetical protein
VVLAIFTPLLGYHSIHFLDECWIKQLWETVDRGGSSSPFKGQVRLSGEQPRSRNVADWEVSEVLALESRRKRGSVRMKQAYLRLKLATGLRQTDLLRVSPSDATPEGIAVPCTALPEPIGSPPLHQSRNNLQREMELWRQNLGQIAFKA